MACAVLEGSTEHGADENAVDDYRFPTGHAAHFRARVPQVMPSQPAAPWCMPGLWVPENPTV